MPPPANFLLHSVPADYEFTWHGWRPNARCPATSAATTSRGLRFVPGLTVNRLPVSYRCCERHATTALRVFASETHSFAAGQTTKSKRAKKKPRNRPRKAKKVTPIKPLPSPQGESGDPPPWHVCSGHAHVNRAITGSNFCTFCSSLDLAPKGVRVPSTSDAHLPEAPPGKPFNERCQLDKLLAGGGTIPAVPAGEETPWQAESIAKDQPTRGRPVSRGPP